jgi:hypothetical protein
MAGQITVSTLRDDTGVLATQNGMNGIAKAWVNFNGTNGSIRASFNVSSVTRNSTGQYAVTFTTAMPNANYAVNFSLNGGNLYGGTLNTPSTGSFTMYSWNDASGLVDLDYVMLSVFR